jgi:hypothetical protein
MAFPEQMTRSVEVHAAEQAEAARALEMAIDLVTELAALPAPDPR